MKAAAASENEGSWLSHSLPCFREEYLTKIERRVKDYKIETINEPREGKHLLVLDIDYTLFGEHQSYAQHKLLRSYAFWKVSKVQMIVIIILELLVVAKFLPPPAANTAIGILSSCGIVSWYWSTGNKGGD